MEEIHRIAHEYMQEEDVSKVVSGKRKNPTSQPNKGGSQGPSTLPTKPLVPRQGDEDEREGWNPRSQRQTELAPNMVQVVINVVVRTNQLGKSKSEAKKDIKVQSIEALRMEKILVVQFTP
ncbi:hypothetical protein PIB30_027262 [Stylosanthes scabra]|uniref:Uncharacterized protein n=1 Tax=Stylosanthes scabra TaxID=79078 RepID=A0ABU6WAU6_9FABA|nr:hypothetical protein [Stylosanthes scabra]